ncbi:MAG TPA: DUF2179 domain-containing protein [Anaerolineaceae bacterium]|nr:DUF2179 domain-containing protein [Anaerolineaceae bacterium]
MLETLAQANIDWYSWVILPLIIFFARICDVTLGTIRIISVSRGLRKLAPILGFFEVLIWIVVIGQLVQNLKSPTAYFGYAAGFACGNYIGMFIEQKLAIGIYMVRIFISETKNDLACSLRSKGYGVTVFHGDGFMGPVQMLYITVQRKQMEDLMKVVHAEVPEAFITVEEARTAEKGYFTAVGNPKPFSRNSIRLSK